MLSCCRHRFGRAKLVQHSLQLRKLCSSAHITKPTARKAGSACYTLLQGTYEKLKSEVPKYKMITPSVLSDRLRVSLYFGCLVVCQAVPRGCLPHHLGCTSGPVA